VAVVMPTKKEFEKVVNLKDKVDALQQDLA